MRKKPANSNTEYGSAGMLCFAVSKHLAIYGTEWKRSSHHAVFCGLRAPCRLRNWVKTVFIRPVNSLPYISSHVTHAFGILTVKRIRFIGRRIVLSSVDASPVNWDIDVPLPSERFFLCCMVYEGARLTRLSVFSFCGFRCLPTIWPYSTCPLSYRWCFNLAITEWLTLKRLATCLYVIPPLTIPTA